MRDIHIIKIGGNVINSEAVLEETVRAIAGIAAPVILVHGGGKQVDQWMTRLGAKVNMVDGRRITDALSLELAVMNYAGSLNKKIVAMLEKNQRLALGISGADLHCIRSQKRVHPTIDFGFVGDVVSVNAEAFSWFIDKQIVPVCCAITCDENGQLLNTNADTIAAEIAMAMTLKYRVNIWYCFEKKGVLENVEDECSVIRELNFDRYQSMLENQQIQAGMKPKLENCFRALRNGVAQIHITDSDGIKGIPEASGTKISL